jgi:hypothetical protein
VAQGVLNDSANGRHSRISDGREVARFINPGELTPYDPTGFRDVCGLASVTDSASTNAVHTSQVSFGDKSLAAGFEIADPIQSEFIDAE